MTTLTRDEAKVLLAGGQKRPRKYRNQPTTVDDIRFDSKLEANRYSHLKMRERAGEIANVELQPGFALKAENGEVVATYKADFSYEDAILKRRVVEDCKGGKATQTAVFKLKSRMFRAQYGFPITIVERANA